MEEEIIFRIIYFDLGLLKHSIIPLITNYVYSDVKRGKIVKGFVEQRNYKKGTYS